MLIGHNDDALINTDHNYRNTPFDSTYIDKYIYKNLSESEAHITNNIARKCSFAVHNDFSAPVDHQSAFSFSLISAIISLLHPSYNPGPEISPSSRAASCTVG